MCLFWELLQLYLPPSPPHFVVTLQMWRGAEPRQLHRAVALKTSHWSQNKYRVKEGSRRDVLWLLAQGNETLERWHYQHVGWYIHWESVAASFSWRCVCAYVRVGVYVCVCGERDCDKIRAQIDRETLDGWKMFNTSHLLLDPLVQPSACYSRTQSLINISIEPVIICSTPKSLRCEMKNETLNFFFFLFPITPAFI